jgi:hypothetical protein
MRTGARNSSETRLVACRPARSDKGVANIWPIWPTKFPTITRSTQSREMLTAERASEYVDLLRASGFGVVEHIIEDPKAGGRTVWLARRRTPFQG